MPCDPDIPYPDSPQGAEEAAVKIMRAIENLPWLDRLYGIARRLRQRQENGKESVTPAVYYRQQEYHPLDMDDRVRAMAFLVLDDPQDIKWQHASVAMAFQLSVIVVANLKRINNTQAFDRLYDQVLLMETMTAIAKNRRSAITLLKAYTQSPETVFAGFSVTEKEKACFMYPYTAFRIACKVEIESCSVPATPIIAVC